jgi:hypothetical protein
MMNHDNVMTLHPTVLTCHCRYGKRVSSAEIAIEADGEYEGGMREK